MSRKSTLIHEYTRLFRSSHHGAYKTRETRLRIMRAITKDLTYLRCAPRFWRLLSFDQLNRLVIYWKSKSIKLSTIANRLSVFRKLFSLLHIPVPSNAELGIIVPATQKTLLLSAYILSQINSPLIQTILEFEIAFGLKKSESIRLSITSITEDTIYIPRDIAYNHRDRIVSIENSTQHTAIQHRVQVLKNYNSQDTLLQTINLPGQQAFHKLSQLYRDTLLVLGIKGHSRFRDIYINHRFEVLSKRMEEDEAIKTLQAELGLMSNQTLKKLLVRS